MNRLHRFLIEKMPRKLLSHLWGSIANCRISWMKNGLIKSLIKIYSIDVSKIFGESPSDYLTLNAFFARSFKQQNQLVDVDSRTILSPVDGCISQLGPIEHGRLFQAKGLYYSLQELLVQREYECFQQGSFLTCYLSPRDCHCVHMPFSGLLYRMIYVSGRLLSVRPSMVQNIPHLFTRNERVICFFETVQGKMAVIFVGAMFVGGIHTQWLGRVHPQVNKTFGEDSEWFYKNSILFEKGQKIGHFEFGSTVIIVTECAVKWQSNLNEGSYLQMGQSVGDYL